MWITGILERGKGTDGGKITTEKNNFPESNKDIRLQTERILELYVTLILKKDPSTYRYNSWTPRKKEHLQALRQKQLNYKKKRIRLALDFYFAALKAWRMWNKVYSLLEVKEDVLSIL